MKIRTRTQDSFSTVRLMESEFINGKMENCMMGNGLKDSKKVMEYGKERMEVLTPASGLSLKRMVKVFTFGQPVISMKGNGKIA